LDVEQKALVGLVQKKGFGTKHISTGCGGWQKPQHGLDLVVD
jgi:hypothetical protein